MYKNAVQPGDLLESVLAAPTLTESVVFYDDYARLEAHRKQQCEDARLECEALRENRFTDNVKVWASDAFGRDSTIALAEKGRAWLKDNKLDDVIDFQYVKGDIQKADQLRVELEKGGVVVISSGSGSEWQRVDKARSQKGLYPSGHWICFYGYSEGVFCANDSAVNAKRGDGCPYTEEQMQQWLDGRSYHSACVLIQKASAA